MVSPLSQAIAFQNSVNPAQSGIAPTDVVGSYKLASDAAEKNYQAKLAANNALWGGLAGLGGAGIMAFGPSAAKSFFGQGAATVAPSAATAAAPVASDAAATATPSVLGALPGMGDAVASPLMAGLTDAGSIAAPTVAADLAATAPEAGAAAAAGTDLLAGLPEWLLPLLFAA